MAPGDRPVNYAIGKYEYVRSSDVNTFLSLQFALPPDVHVSASLYVDDELHSTACTSLELPGRRGGSNYDVAFEDPSSAESHLPLRSLSFPMRVCNLPLRSTLVFEFGADRPELDDGCIGYGSLSLFSNTAVLKQGRQLVTLRNEQMPLTRFPWGEDVTSEELDLETLLDLHSRPGNNNDNNNDSDNKMARPLPPLKTDLNQKILYQLPTPLTLNATEELRKNDRIVQVYLPTFSHTVLYSSNYEKPSTMSCPQEPLAMSDTIESEPTRDRSLLHIWDADIYSRSVPDVETFSHPMHLKNLRLSPKRNSSSTLDCRPDHKELTELTDLIRKPKRQFSATEKQLLFRFRMTLKDQKEALVKFLLAIDWTDEDERSEAHRLLYLWAPIDVDHALGLLSKDFIGLKEVRQFAVECLAKASEDELLLFLLQLVQALRYDEALEEHGSEFGPLAEFLFDKAVGSTSLATFLNWYLMAEIDNDTRIFSRLRKECMERLNNESREIAHVIERQIDLRKKWLWALRYAQGARRDRIEVKNERLREALESVQEPTPIAVPGDPTRRLCRIIAEESFVAKSSMYPVVLQFEVVESDRWNPFKKKYMLKEGDDLRQDQLVMQMIILMDSLLKRYGMDLKLTPYRVMAMSTQDGIIEFVPDSQAMSSILKNFDSDLLKFFRTHRADSEAPYGIEPEVLDNFIRSCAGYCVITYILGIGDRHLDNLLVTTDGYMFHIDFGFILGKDPKPFPPPMKLCREMVEAMGGAESAGYQSFQRKCCECYRILRRHCSLVVNLLYLMSDSGIKDLDDFSIRKVQEKFQEDLNDEEAETHFCTLIDESVSALFPQLMEKVHKWALYWR